MSTATIPDSAVRASIRAIRKNESAELMEFDGEFVRNALIQAAARELSFVAHSARDSLKDQSTSISQSAADFDAIIARMANIMSCVQDVERSVCEAARESEDTSQELKNVSARMQSLETQIGAIDRLVGTINKVADQSRLLALNATIEAARAGEMGKGFGVVAHEVKELAATTKEVNEKVRGTLTQINSALRDLSNSVGKSVNVVQRTIETVNVAREKAESIEQETTRFDDQLRVSLEHIHQLSQSSTTCNNELNEVNTIGETFRCLLSLMEARGEFGEAIDPLDRLGPIVAQSTFHDPTRFTTFEQEYQLAENDILISATDAKGIITFANNTFYKIAEYEPGELVGRPHNVIRHPDMPKTAFADLWAVIQAGKTWQGYVKNRAKSGRMYWVKASVFPCYDKGQIVGYISIRTKPDPSRIKQAMEAYRRVP